jgi:hypothetical protein
LTLSACLTVALAGTGLFPDKTFPVSTDDGQYYAFVNSDSKCLVTGEGGGCGDDSQESCERACKLVMQNKLLKSCKWDEKSFTCEAVTLSGVTETLTEFLSSSAGIPFCNDPSIHTAGCTIEQGFVNVPKLIAGTSNGDSVLNTWIIRSWFGTSHQSGESFNAQANVLITKDVIKNATGAVQPMEQPMSGCEFLFTKGTADWNVVPKKVVSAKGFTNCGVTNRIVADSPFEHGALIPIMDSTTKLGFNVGKCGDGETQLGCNDACTETQSVLPHAGTEKGTASAEPLVLLLSPKISNLEITVFKRKGHTTPHGPCDATKYPNGLALGDDVCKAFAAGCGGTCPKYQAVVKEAWAKGCAELPSAQISQLYAANDNSEAGQRILELSQSGGSTQDHLVCDIAAKNCSISTPGKASPAKVTFVCQECSSSHPCTDSKGKTVSTVGRRCTVHGYTIVYSAVVTSEVIFKPYVNGTIKADGQCLLTGMTTNGDDYHGKYSNLVPYTNSTDIPGFSAICGVSHSAYAGRPGVAPTQSEYDLMAKGTFSSDVAFSIGMCDTGMEKPPSGSNYLSCKNVM